MKWYCGSATTLALLALVACGGDDGGNGPTGPTANFAAPTCNQLSCSFTDASTGTVASRTWTFESGTPATSTDANPTVVFPASGTYTVTLEVSDNAGNSDDFSRDVTVTGAPGNTNPTANFSFSCAGLDCSFNDASSDPDAGDGIASWSWNFDDGSAAVTTQNPDHTYTGITDPTTKHVTLTVTDNNGGTGQVTKDVAITPPGGLECDNGSGTFVGCSLNLTSKSVITITLAAEDCNANGNTLAITSPIQETIFTDACHTPVPGTPAAVVVINGGNAFAAGTQLSAQMTSGSTDPNRIPPEVHVTGTFPDWTLAFDDGEGCQGDPTCGGTEPDFDDLTITVHADIVP
jgi:PKD repeat protein